MSNSYTIILEFPDTEGYDLEESISFWLDEYYPNIDIFSEGECQILLPKLDYQTIKSIINWVDKNPAIKRKLLKVTEIIEQIKELPVDE